MLHELQICQHLAITLSENCINIISIWDFGFWRVLDCRKRLFLGVSDEYIPHVDQEIISHQMKDISPLPLRVVLRGQLKDMRATWDDIHVKSSKIVQFSRPATPLIHLCPKFFHPLELGCPNEPLLTNQLKENIIQGWLLHVIRSFL